MKRLPPLKNIDPERFPEDNTLKESVKILT